GSFDKVSLDGLSLGFGLHTPGPLHKGNGTGVWFYDKKADATQQDALEKITTAQAGGMPFEIFKAIISTWLPAQHRTFDYAGNGRNSGVRVGEAVTITLEPIKNPISGDPESIRVEHSTGFMFKTAEVLSAKECKSAVP